jgi:crotonobetainyl-CoA:carnitine CoA-transferase CaiB-like acyl-CoA transferase
LLLDGHGRTGLTATRRTDLNYIGIAGILGLTAKGSPVIPGIQIADLVGGGFMQ